VRPLNPDGVHLPVDIYIPGCPPRPEGLIFGFLKLQQLIRIRAATGPTEPSVRTCQTSSGRSNRRLKVAGPQRL